jgi:hypothetical protein
MLAINKNCLPMQFGDNLALSKSPIGSWLKDKPAALCV